MDSEHYDIFIDQTQKSIKAYRVYNGNYVEIKSETHIINEEPLNIWIFLFLYVVVCYFS